MIQVTLLHQHTCHTTKVKQFLRSMETSKRLIPVLPFSTTKTHCIAI